MIVHEFVLSSDYNGIINAFYLASGVFINSMLYMFKKHITARQILTTAIGGVLPILVALVKMVFFERVEVHLGWPWWISPSVDIFVALIIIGMFLRLIYWSRNY